MQTYPKRPVKDEDEDEDEDETSRPYPPKPHVPEQLGRKQLCAVPDVRERVCELRGVREWVRRVPELHAAVQRD